MKGYLLLVLFSYIMSTTEIASVISEFEIFAHKPVQTSVLGTIETAYNAIACVDLNDLEIFYTCR